jgi:hypothetical protein
MVKKISRNDFYNFLVNLHEYMYADLWQDTEGFSGEITTGYAKTWLSDNIHWAPHRIRIINHFNNYIAS